MVSAFLGQAFDAIAIQLGIIDCLSTGAFVGQEVQEFVPSYLFVVLAVKLADHSLESSVRNIDSLLELVNEFESRNSFVFVLCVFGHSLGNWFVLWEQFLHDLQFLRWEVKRMQLLLWQVLQGLEFVFNFNELLLGECESFSRLLR